MGRLIQRGRDERELKKLLDDLDKPMPAQEVERSIPARPKKEKKTVQKVEAEESSFLVFWLTFPFMFLFFLSVPNGLVMVGVLCGVFALGFLTREPNSNGELRTPEAMSLIVLGTAVAFIAAAFANGVIS